jgi:site-specific DNA-methyltransferase (adenine-specific)
MALMLKEGDCLDPSTGLDMLPVRVDHVITDPPFSPYVHAHAMRGTTDRGESKAIDFEPITPERIEYVAAHIARITRRWAIVFCDIESSHLWAQGLERGGLRYMRTGGWIKLGAMPQFSGDRPAVGFDGIVIAHGLGPSSWNGGGRPAVWSWPLAGREGPALHATQKPVGLMAQLVRDFSDKGDLICDPFMGVGTTGAAALHLGRSFIGWERDPRYFRIAARRLARVREQLELPIAPERRWRQERLGL